MLDLKEIEGEISRLENGSTTYHACEKLSVLYAVRNNLGIYEDKNQRVYNSSYSYANAPKSEFMEAVEGKDTASVLEIIDKHMQAIQLVYPKEYDLILQKIREV